MSNSAGAAPNYGQVTKQTMQAQLDLAPQQYASEATYQPKYTALEANNLDAILNGTAASPSLTGVLARANTASRAADVNDMTALGPQATQAMLYANPANAQLLSKLNAQANSELDAGSGLTADQTRAMQQMSRAAFAARGTSGYPAAMVDEILRQFNLGQQLLQQRQQFATGVIGANQQVTGDPMMAILGRSSGALPLAASAKTGPQLFNPQAGLGLAQSNFGTQAEVAAGQPTTFEEISAAMPKSS